VTCQNKVKKTTMLKCDDLSKQSLAKWAIHHTLDVFRRCGRVQFGKELNAGTRSPLQQFAYVGKGRRKGSFDLEKINYFWIGRSFEKNSFYFFVQPG
jgi:hypothetical protein